MHQNLQKTALPSVFLCLLLASSIVMSNSWAHKPTLIALDDGYELSKKARQEQRQSPDLLFNPVRKNLLTNLLLGHALKHNLIDEEIRYKIHRQSPTPPGIRRNLIKGKSIPPNFLEQVISLPQSVNTYLGLSSQASIRIGILGSDVLLYNPTNGVIYDTIPDFL